MDGELNGAPASWYTRYELYWDLNPVIISIYILEEDLTIMIIQISWKNLPINTLHACAATPTFPPYISIKTQNLAEMKYWP